MRRLIRCPIVVIGMCLLAGAGCPGEPPPLPANAPRDVVPEQPIHLLVIDDPALAQVIQQQWNARAELDLILSELTSAEFLQQDRQAALSVDLIIYPSYLIGLLAERGWIVPVPQHVLDTPQLSVRDILPMVRLRETRWGEDVYALSFGSPQLTLFYRADVLKHLGQKVPGTWDEYQELVRLCADPALLGELASTGGQPWSATLEPLGPGWAGQVLIARAAAYVKHRDSFSTFFHYRTLEPLVDGPPFVRALEQLVAAAQTGPAEVVQLTPHDVRSEFLEGRCAMALTWPAGVEVEGPPTGPVPTEYAALPGAREVYYLRDREWQPRSEEMGFAVPLLSVAGRMASVTSRSRRTRSAFHVLVWLTGKELSSEIAPLSSSTGVFRYTRRRLDQLGAPRPLLLPERWFPKETSPQEIRQYASVVQTVHTRPSWMMSLRIPGCTRYLEALDTAVHRAVAGELDAAAALQEAAARWREITNELGHEQQREAFQHSIGL